MILLYHFSAAPRAGRESEANAFFRKVISPFIDGTLDSELLEPLMVHFIKDEMQKKNARESQCLPPEQALKPVSSVEEVQQAILQAKSEKKVLRVAGSEHSVHASIFPNDGVTLLLTKRLRKVEILKVEEECGKKWLYCRIGGGCYLGKNPLDPTSDIQSSACYQVAVQGFGFPELGGIIHQSVAGFISTGSAG